MPGRTWWVPSGRRSRAPRPVGRGGRPAGGPVRRRDRKGVVREFSASAAATDDHLVVVTVRADQIAGLSIDPRLAQLTERDCTWSGPLTDDQLREVIEEPATGRPAARGTGWSSCWSTSRGDGAGSLPLLSHALVETWRRRDGAVLTVDGYEASGGIAAAVAQTAERVYQGYSQEDRATCAACCCDW